MQSNEGDQTMSTDVTNLWLVAGLPAACCGVWLLLCWVCGRGQR